MVLNGFKKIEWLSGAVAATLLLSCKTTSPIVKVSQDQKNITMYSSGERDSSLANADNNESIDKAIAKVKERLKAEPKNVELLTDLSRLYLVKKSVKQSREACVNALSNDIHHARANRLMAEIELADGQLEKSEVILNRLGGFDAKDSDIQNLLGLIALKRGNNNEAFDFFQQGLKVDGKNVAIKMNLGTLYLKYRQVRQADTQFAQVIEIFPEHVDALIHLGITKSYFGQYTEAQAYYEKALDLSRNNILALYNFALLEQKMDNLKAAQDRVKLVLASPNLTVSQQRSAQDLQDELKTEIKRRDDEEKRKKDEESGVKSLAAKLKKDEKAKDRGKEKEKGK